MNASMFCARLGALLDDQAEWSQATFGSDDSKGPIGGLIHLKKEIQEIIDNPGDIMEWADAFLLFCDNFRRQKLTLLMIIEAAEKKMEINKSREWPLPEDPNQPIEHKRDDLHLDVDLEQARALHRIWRALNDGACPSCLHLHHPESKQLKYPAFGPGSIGIGIQCAFCGFSVTGEEIAEIEQMFKPAMHAALAIFKKWRKERSDHGRE